MTPPVSPILVDKVLRDAGFDLVAAMPGDWMSGRTSGLPGRLAVRPQTPHIALALPAAGLATSMGLPIAQDVLPPEGFVEVASCASIEALLSALRVARSLLAHPATEMIERVETRLASVPVTERTAEVRRRIGQDVFREALFELWEGRCAITSLALPSPLLRASHAKPWAEASDQERLDPFNGLLLAVHLDALFDSGLMVVTDEGQVLISPKITADVRANWSLHDELRVRRLLPGHLPYVRHHRERVGWIRELPAGDPDSGSRT